MSSMQSPRFKLPFLATGQAQKELFHNEALGYLDFIVHPVVQSIENDPVSVNPEPGQSWLVDSAPVGDWFGYANHIANWSDGGWRYLEPLEHMQVYVASLEETSVYQQDNWTSVGQIAVPNGGSVVDAEARAAIGSILTALHQKQIIAE